MLEAITEEQKNGENDSGVDVELLDGKTEALNINAPVAQLPRLLTKNPPSNISSPTTPKTNDQFFVDSPATPQTPEIPQQSSNGLTSALNEVKHFVGGLIAHPVEITKNYSVLRHSHGLVYYKGPATNVAITVFSKKPLPDNRRIFLQKKGFFGRSGWAAKAIVRANGSWIDVTPDQIAKPTHVPVSDERAWQRDIGRFQKKAGKPANKHVLRETNVIRIPFEAGDGYFRLVLCAGDSKAILCPSPLFRIASLSTSNAAIKGSPVAALPIERGTSVGQHVAKSHAGAYATGLVSAAKNQMSSIVPTWATSTVQNVAPTAYDATGAKAKVTDLNKSYDDSYDAQMQPVEKGRSWSNSRRLEDDGPAEPFPILCNSKISEHKPIETEFYRGIQMSLSSPPEKVKRQLSGAFFGWVTIHTPPKRRRLQKRDTNEPTSPKRSISRSIIGPLVSPKKASASPQDSPISPQTDENGKSPASPKDQEGDLSALPTMTPTETNTPDELSQSPSQEGWQEALITIFPCDESTPQIAPQKVVKIYLLDPFSSIEIEPNSSAEVMIMGYLHSLQYNRPLSPQRIYSNIAMARTLLDQPGYSVDEADVLLRERKARQKSLTDRYAGARQAGQDAMDKVPLHWAGNRIGSAGVRDQGYGKGGLCIKR